MKHIFLLLFLAYSSLSTGREITIFAKIVNPTDREMSFSFPTDVLLDEEKQAVASLNANNEVYSVIDFTGEQLLTVGYGGFKFDIFIENENRISFELNAADALNSLKFSGEGAAANNALTQYRQRFEPQPQRLALQKGYLTLHLNQKAAGSIAALSLPQYEAEIEATFNRKMLWFATVSGVSEAFKLFLQQKINYGTAADKLAYFWVNEARVTPADAEAVMSKSSFKANTPLLDAAISHPDYRNYWVTFLFLQHLKKADNASAAAGMYAAAAALQGETRDWFCAKMLINAKKENYLTLAEQHFSSFKANASSQKYVRKVSDFYGSDLPVSDEGPAPEFMFADETGKIRSLSEFRGKVVYISYWATWCKPCLVGFRNTESLRHQMQDLGVVLLNISLDQREDVWRGTMQRVPMPGINLFAGNDEKLKLDYELSKLPAYFIVDKNGNFAYLSEGTRNILDEFKLLVQE